MSLRYSRGSDRGQVPALRHGGHRAHVTVRRFPVPDVTEEWDFELCLIFIHFVVN